MKYLFIGDVVASCGCKKLASVLPSLKRETGAVLTVVNGENSADGNGITPESLRMLYNAGADVVTTGNHVFRRREIYESLDGDETLLRPANYPDAAPGHGVCIIDRGGWRGAVISLMGVYGINSPPACPFETVDKLLSELEREGIKNVFVDLHAEATGEKRALGFYLDGRVTAVLGTHTHVQTADEEILPGGTAYISDVGMTGPSLSCLGVKPQAVIRSLKDKMPSRFDTADTPCYLNGVAVEFDHRTGRALSVERIFIR
ncbi:MAG: TIGR00282 family metallophosphoesterase [Clostridia bacterium]|nr:TIGR00282 family metallophosphoesterase [Clostridia bacterium]